MTLWTQSAPSLFVDVSGNGPSTLLMMHEIGGSCRSWDAIVARLADRFTIVRFDQRGFGLSEKIRASYPPRALADDAWRVLDAVKTNGPIGIVASAAACATAVEMAREAPSRITGLALCAPAMGGDPATRDSALARADRVAAEGMRAIIDGAMKSLYPEAIRESAFEAYRGRFLCNDPVGFALANRAFADSRATLDGLTTPTLVLAGTHDVRPIEAITAQAATARDAHVEIVANAGHVMAVQQPEAVAAHIARFFGMPAESRRAGVRGAAPMKSERAPRHGRPGLGSAAFAAGMIMLAVPAEAAPKRAWASTGHVIDLGLNSAVHGNALDRLMIQEAFGRWGIAYDEGRLDVVTSLFTKDAQYRVLNGSPTPIVALDGRDNIVAGVRRAIEEQGDQRRHAISNVVIDRLTSTTATVAAYGVVVLPDDPIVVGATAVYSADLVREGGVWKFRRFVIAMDRYAGPLPNVQRK